MKRKSDVSKMKLSASEILMHVTFVFGNSFIRILIDVLRGFEREFCSITVFREIDSF
jgi:hypothetical protein